MKKIVILLGISFFVIFGALAKTLDQKKNELKKIYQDGGISKAEYEKALAYIEEPKSEKQKNTKAKKKSFSLKNKDKKKDLLKKLGFKKEKDLGEITLEKIDQLGKPIKFDDSYYLDGMNKKFKGCNNSFKCKGKKAGTVLYETFNKDKSYGQKYPGKMIKAMAMYEVFYSSKLWYAKKSLERYKEDNYKGLYKLQKKDDEKEIRSLIGMNKGRKSMREALGMTVDTPTKEAIRKFWLLGEFLDLGTVVKNEKLDQDLKKRKELLENYKAQIANLKKKLEDEVDKDENEKSIE